MQLNISSLHYTYPESAEPALCGLSATLPCGWTGIVGDNGSGKSTLAKILCGQLKQDGGSFAPALRAAYCQQDASTPSENLQDFICSYDKEALMLRNAFGIEEDWGWRFDTLSCGQQKRMQIACALWAEPQLLIMDEPTNHVDAPTREIIANALTRFRGIGILISHDRTLLDELCTQCLFMENGTGVMRPGGFSQGQDQAGLERATTLREKEKAKNELQRLKKEAQSRSEQASRTASRRSARNVAKHDSDAREKIRLAVYSGQDGKAGKLSARMDSRVQQASATLSDLHVQKRYEGNFHTNAEASRRPVVLHVPEMSLPLGEERTLQIPQLFVENHDHIGLAGPNGWGKTTLVKQLMGMVDDGVRILYLPQEPTADQRKSALRSLQELNNKDRGEVLKTVARLNSQPERFMEGDELSPGELRKLMLALGMLENPELMILDEPTNHLDIGSVLALERFLTTFPGAFLLVTHDQALLEGTTSRIWEITQEDEATLRLI